MFRSRIWHWIEYSSFSIDRADLRQRMMGTSSRRVQIFSLDEDPIDMCRISIVLDCKIHMAYLVGTLLLILAFKGSANQTHARSTIHDFVLLCITCLFV